MRKCRNAEMPKCRNAEMQKCRMRNQHGNAECKLQNANRSVEIEVPRRFRNGLPVRLLQRFLEPARERISSRLLRVNRLLEDLLAAGRLLGEDALSVADLRLVA